jgi:dienelactone hydrolase
MKVLVAVLLVTLAAPAAAAPLDPVVEAKNFSKTEERQSLYDSVQGQLLLRQVSTANGTAALQAQVDDPDRSFTTDLCWNGFDGCAGDARLYDWAAKGYGTVKPVLFTARNGATLSGHVWATKAGPAKRPGVVITNGSVQANEQLYWYAAQALAKEGYVVLTWDPQGQGQSDTAGEGADATEGVPAQTDGRPFYDGTEDALNFFFSTQSRPYEPAKSCNSDTSHAAKQDRRVKAGLDTAYNPYASLLDRSRVGIAGHSYGAAGVSYVGQADPRVKAIVAWDNLAATDKGADPTSGIGEQGCKDAAARKVAPLTKPALGMSADYGLPPTPNTAAPDPVGKSTASLLYTKAGVDTGEIIIRGGSHLDFSFISNPAFGASLRGADLIDWYTTAWFDKYVKGDATADDRLLTDRWRHDGDGAAVDPDHDANDFSFYYKSRLDFHKADGTPYVCEDLRPGSCPLGSDDGFAGDYSYLALVTSPDRAGAGPRSPGRLRAPAHRKACTSRRRIVIHLPRTYGAKIMRVLAVTHGRVVGRSRRRRVVVRLKGLPKTTARVKLFVTLRANGRPRHAVVTRVYRTCRPKPR